MKLIQRKSMNSIIPILLEFQKNYLTPKNLTLSNYQLDPESAEYSGCSFNLNQDRVHFRCAKITPTKIGQFVTFYKRSNAGPIIPYDLNDSFDTLMVYTKTTIYQGVFIFPKNILEQKDLISKEAKGGKRAFRLYPLWDKAENAQAKKTQEWQLKYFIPIEQNA